MKYLIIEIRNLALRIANVDYKGKDVTFEKTGEFPLSDSIINDVSLADTDSFTAFLSDCLIKGGFNKEKTIVLLYDSQILMKEFEHPKVTAEELKGLTSIEAENMLPGGIEGYYVGSSDYGDRPDFDNKYKGVIYAIKKGYIDNLSAALLKAGLHAVRIAPFVDSYTNVFRELLEQNVIPDLSEKTVAAINFEAKRVILTVFANKVPIFQRVSNSASHIIDNIIAETLNCSIDEAREYKMTKGLLYNHDESEDDVNLNNRITKITHSMIEDIMRSIRLTLAVLRLELDKIVITGGFSYMPGLPEHIEEISGISCVRIDRYRDFVDKVIKFKANPDDITNLANFVTMAGAGAAKTAHPVNFLPIKHHKKAEAATAVLLCGIIAFLMVVIMAYQPFVYFQAVNQKKAYNDVLNKTAYQSIKQKRDELTALQNQLLQKTSEKAGVPGLTAAGGVVETLTSYLNTSIALKSISYDESKKTYSVKLITTKDKQNEINAFKDKVDKSGLFAITNNIITTYDEAAKIYNYDFEIQLITK